MFNAVCFVNTLEGPEEEKHSLSGYLLKIKNLNWIELNINILIVYLHEHVIFPIWSLSNYAYNINAIYPLVV